MRFFTLGVGTRHPLDFGRLLAKYGIQVVFDVRRLPLREPGFDREALQRLCDAAGTSYVFLGNELGADLGYRSWVRSEPVTRWLGVIRRKLESRAVCLLCRETSPAHCRRRALADELAGEGVEAVHILDERQLWHPGPEGPGRPAPRPRRSPRPGGPSRPPASRRRRRDDRRNR